MTKQELKKRLLLALNLLSQFGFDPVKSFRAFRGLPPFFRDYKAFRQGTSVELRIYPCLHDRYNEAGITKSEYFWQDLIVARWIYKASPIRHVDVGSRTDGFVAHVASFRQLEVFDVRPITTEIPGVTFQQLDVMDSSAMSVLQNKNCRGGEGYCDSLSCLHVLEHFGLGRYGDPIDPSGYKTGFVNLTSLLRPGGHFYLSTPIGKERVEFNANWVFNPLTILRLAKDQGLQLERFLVFNPLTGLREIGDDERSEALARLGNENYNLGIFAFTRPLPSRAA